MKKIYLLLFVLSFSSFTLYSQSDYDLSMAIKKNDKFSIIFYGEKYLKTVYADKKISFEKKYEKYNEILPHIYNMIDSIVNPTQRPVFFGGMSEIYFNYINICYVVYKKNGSKKYIEKAFTFIEQYKNLLLQNHIRDINAGLKNKLPDSLLKKEAYLYAMSVLNEDNRTKRDSFYDLTREFYNTIEKKYPEYYNLKSESSKFHFKDIFKNINDRILIEFIFTKNEYFRFVFSKNDTLFDKIKISSSQINNKIDTCINSLWQNNYFMFYRNSHKLYNLLFSDIFHLCENKEIIIVPDGKINFLPFEALLKDTLHDKDEDYRKLNYLIKNNCIFSYEISTKSYIDNLKKYARKKQTNNDIDLFAPVFDNHNENKCNVKPLHDTKKFAKYLDKKYKANIFLHEQATIKTFIQKQETSNILHIASHGKIEKNSMSSFIMFNSGTKNNCPDSLFLYDIYSSFSNANLVIVESCESGKGKYVVNEGVMNFAHGFKFSGASSVIYTLWEIEEEVTNEILKYFYYELSCNKNKNTALHNAKLNFINNYAEQELASPLFWSGAVISGDVSPIKITTNNNTYYVVLSIVVIIFISLLFFLWIRKGKSRIGNIV